MNDKNLVAELMKEIQKLTEQEQKEFLHKLLAIKK